MVHPITKQTKSIIIWGYNFVKLVPAGILLVVVPEVKYVRINSVNSSQMFKAPNCKTSCKSCRIYWRISPLHVLNAIMKIWKNFHIECTMFDLILKQPIFSYCTSTQKLNICMYTLEQNNIQIFLQDSRGPGNRVFQPS